MLNEDYASATCKTLFRDECGDKVEKDKARKSACDIYAQALAESQGKGKGDKCQGGPVIKGPCDTVGVIEDPAGSLASAAFDAAAGKFGSAATRILHSMTTMFLKVSTIDLRTAGISTTYSLTWALSATLAVLLLLWQFTKLAATGQGAVGATAVSGLVKWAIISASSLAVTQVALTASDEVSNAVINSFYRDGGEKAFQEHIDQAWGKFFSSPQENSAMILLFGILSILVVLVLWGEMLLRQAAIQVLLSVMPIVAAGTMMDGTREWWPKARNALISLILIKPIIVLIFVLGFRETGSSSDMQPFLVGLLTVFLAAVAWPALAKFMPFTSVGSGGGLASGLIGAAGGSAGSMFGHGGGTPSGAGSVGNGKSFTKAVEAENDTAAAPGAGGKAGSAQGKAGTAGKAAGGAASGGLLFAAAMGAQVAKAGKEVAEGGMEATAAHAGLGPGKDMGGQVTLPRDMGGTSATAPAVPPAKSAPDAPQPSGPGQVPRVEAPPAPPQTAPRQEAPDLPPPRQPKPVLPPVPPRENGGSNS